MSELRSEPLACRVDGMSGSTVAADSRGLQYGDGLFETMLWNDRGCGLWPLHWARLQTDCGRLGMSAPADERALWAECAQAADGLGPVLVKLIVCRRPGGRGYRAAGGETQQIILVYPRPATRDVCTLSTLSLQLSRQPLLAGIKHLSRLEQVLAAEQLATAGSDEGILSDDQGQVIEAVSANLFLVEAGRLYTPALDQAGVAGVARAAILDSFADRCEVTAMAGSRLERADELFLCNSVRGISAVSHLDGRPVGDGNGPGPVTRELQQWWRGLGL